MSKRFSALLLVVLILSIWQLFPVQAQSTVYFIPKSDSQYNPPGTTLAIRYGDLIDSSTVKSQIFSVSGSLSGDHSGAAILAHDQKTIIFKPDVPFSPGETVSASLSGGIRAASGKVLSGISYSFKISEGSPSVSRNPFPEIEYTLPPATTSAPKPGIVNHPSSYVTIPSDFPTITVTVPATNTAEGYIFASNWLPGAFVGNPNPGSYMLILDNQGEPIYYQKVPETEYVTDFKVLPNGLITYWAADAYHLLDNHYREVDTITAKNGFEDRIDLHDLLLLPNGNYLYMIYNYQYVDMSTIVPGGDSNALVTGLVIQEQDPDQNVVFQWDSFDFIPITDTNQILTAPEIDYVHGNAIDLDSDGNILLSSRHLDEITKIDRQTGEIIWRLGGKANQFTFFNPLNLDDPHFYYQHDIRRLANGNISLFDNHNAQIPQISRAMEFDLNETGKRAILVWDYRNSPDIFSGFMGNVQRLSNGNTAIGWGGNQGISYTEVQPHGDKAFEIVLPPGYVSYRDFRFPWQGYPTWAPDLVLQPGSDTVTLTFSWNGATEISRYAVYGGNTFPPATLLGEPQKNNFETSLELTGAEADYCFYRVMPIDNQDQTTLFSNVVKNPACSFIYLPALLQGGN